MEFLKKQLIHPFLSTTNLGHTQQNDNLFSKFNKLQLQFNFDGKNYHKNFESCDFSTRNAIFMYNVRNNIIAPLITQQNFTNKNSVLKYIWNCKSTLYIDTFIWKTTFKKGKTYSNVINNLNTNLNSTKYILNYFVHSVPNKFFKKDMKKLLETIYEDAQLKLEEVNNYRIARTQEKKTSADYKKDFFKRNVLKFITNNENQTDLISKNVFIFLLKYFYENYTEEDVQLKFIQDFIFIFFNDYFFIENIEEFKKNKDVFYLYSGENFSFDYNNINDDMNYINYIKSIILNFILEDFLDYTELFNEKEAYFINKLQQVKQLRIELAQKINKHPLDQLIKPINKNKKEVPPGTFWTEYSRKRMVRKWQKGIMVATNENYRIWYNTYYNDLLPLFVSLKNKLFMSNISIKGNHPQNFFYKLYYTRWYKRRQPEFPSAPWLQCFKLDIIRLLVDYYADCFPDAWFEINKNYFDSMVKSNNKIYIKLRTKEQYTPKRIFANYLFHVVISIYDEYTSDIFIIKLLKSIRDEPPKPYHYGKTHYIRRFAMEIMTDTFIKRFLPELMQFRYLSDLARGRVSKTFHSADKYWDKVNQGVGDYYMGSLPSSCKIQFAYAIYEDILKFAFHQRKDIFSSHFKYGIFGVKSNYSDEQLKNIKDWYDIDIKEEKPRPTSDEWWEKEVKLKKIKIPKKLPKSKIKKI